MQDLIGTIIGGKYRLEKQLGAGGMGMVFAATQVGLNRRCAVKVLHESLSQDSQLVARFKREAEVAASIGHPNIIQVTDFGYEDGKIFLVMDLLQGMPLANAMQQGPFAAERTRFIAAQVLSALDAAHQREIVHRDLKPDNIYLTSLSGVADVVKLLDFGIARMTSEQSQKMTTTGQVLGTPAYMSPEQARGKPVDHRTDLYSLGVVMYEALSGHMPVKGSNYHELMFNIVGETPVPLQEYRPDLPKGLLDVVAKAMTKDVSQRYQSAPEMRAALEALGPLAASSPAAVQVASTPPGAATTDAFAKTITPEAVQAIDSQRPQGVPAAETAMTQSSGSNSATAIWVGALVVSMLAVAGGVYAFTRPDPELANAPPQVDEQSEQQQSEEMIRRAIEEMHRIDRARADMEVETVETTEMATDSVEPTMSEMSSMTAMHTSAMSAMSAMSARGGRPAHARHTLIDPPPEDHIRRSRCCPDAWHDGYGVPVVWTTCGGGAHEIYPVLPRTRLTFRPTSGNNVVRLDDLRPFGTTHTDAVLACCRGHVIQNGHNVIMHVDAEGRIDRVRLHDYCPAAPAVTSCLRQHFEGLTLPPDREAPGEFRMSIHVVGT